MLNIVIVRINATDPNLQVEGTDQTTRDLLDVHFKDTINAMGE
jgi:hypothetical protein